MAQLLLYPCKRVAITANTEDHGYNAYDFGWDDDDGSGDLGPNAWLTAMADGVVQQIINTHPDYPDDQGYGNYIVISYPSAGYTSLYAHIKRNSFIVKVGDRVKQRQRVCRMDNSGYSFGPHLHLEVCKGTTFTRHGGVDYISRGIVFADEWNVISSDTSRNYDIKRIAIQPTIKDISKTQAMVVDDDLRVRKGPGITYDSVGFAIPGYYNISETKEDNKYIWAKVSGTEYWIATGLEGSELIEAVFVPVEKDETKNQVEITIDDLRIRQEPSTTSSILGYCPMGFYDVEDSSAEKDYVWLKVCGHWIAVVDGVIYHAGKDDKDQKIKELEARIEKLEESITFINNENDILSNAISSIKDICEKVLNKDK